MKTSGMKPEGFGAALIKRAASRREWNLAVHAQESYLENERRQALNRR